MIFVEMLCKITHNLEGVQKNQGIFAHDNHLIIMYLRNVCVHVGVLQA